MLHLIAMFSMLIDHAGFKFDIEIFRVIGRLAMPIYAYFIVQGFHNTKNLKLYTFRVALLALVSQVPYYKFTAARQLNICFLWLLALVFLYARHKINHRVIRLAVGIACILIALYVPLEYSVVGLLWVSMWDLFYYPDGEKDMFYTACVVLLLLFTTYLLYGSLQMWSFLAVPLVIFAHCNDLDRLTKQYKPIWRFFYPVQFYLVDCLSVLG